MSEANGPDQEKHVEESIQANEELNVRDSSDFAFKLVNSVKSMNMGDISYHELANVFITAEELKCLYLFVKALPYSPITPIYPETPFLFLLGNQL